MTSALFRLMMARDSAVWEARRRMNAAEFRYHAIATEHKPRYRTLRVAQKVHNQCIEDLVAAVRAHERVMVYRKRQLAKRKR